MLRGAARVGATGTRIETTEQPYRTMASSPDWRFRYAIASLLAFLWFGVSVWLACHPIR